MNKIIIKSLSSVPLLLLLFRLSFAADSASLQFVIPAPDPVMAGEDVNFQVIAVNSGDQAWAKGSYYWVAEIYDMGYNFVAKTDEVSPPETVEPRGVAAVTLRFHIPEGFVGRRLVRVFFIKDSKILIQSDYKVFQIIERRFLPPPPEKYKFGGDITMTYKNSSSGKWKNHTGQTTANIIGKIEESSFLFNTYLLHSDEKLVDAYVILLNYYAPWGRIGAGDISPTVSPLSLEGQGMRGAMLEQERGRYSWILFGGRLVTSEPGSWDTYTNGRYERQMYGLKASVELFPFLKLSSNYVFGTDAISSLSDDPDSENYKGPTLAPEKNSVYGISLDCELTPDLSIVADFQTSEHSTDTLSNFPVVKDSAWRAQLKWDRNLFKVRAAVQRTGTKFTAFGSPLAVPDRMTRDGSLSLYPASWLSLSAMYNSYTDNLENDPGKTTTTQTQMTFTNSITAPTETAFSVSYSLNTAVGEPSATTMDNQTTTMSFGISQPFRGHSVSAGYTASKFIDNNKLSPDVNSNTISLNAVLSLSSNLSWSLSVVNATSKSEGAIDSSENKSNTYFTSASYSMLLRRLTLQLWATSNTSENVSTLSTSESKTLSVNSELTWAKTEQSNVTFGVGKNTIENNLYPANDIEEITMVLRYSYSF